MEVKGNNSKNWGWEWLEYKEKDRIEVPNVALGSQHQGQKQFIVCEPYINDIHTHCVVTVSTALCQIIGCTNKCFESKYVETRSNQNSCA